MQSGFQTEKVSGWNNLGGFHMHPSGQFGPSSGKFVLQGIAGRNTAKLLRIARLPIAYGPAQYRREPDPACVSPYRKYLRASLQRSW